MVHQISYASVGFADRDVEAALDAIAAARFDAVEILGQAPHVESPPTGAALSAFVKRLEARRIRARTVHAPLTRNVLGAPEESWRREKVKVLASYLHFAGALGATEVVIHPVPNPCFVPDAEDPEVPGRIKSAVRRSLDDLAPVAKAASTRITLENLPYHCAYPYLTMDELRPLVDDYEPDLVGLVVDTGHAWTVGREPDSEIRTAGPRLCGTHLQDVDRNAPDDQHWAPTHGGLDWDAICAALVQVGYDGPWTFEVYNPRHGESQEQLADLVRQFADRWVPKPA